MVRCKKINYAALRRGGRILFVLIQKGFKKIKSPSRKSMNAQWGRFETRVYKTNAQTSNLQLTVSVHLRDERQIHAVNSELRNRVTLARLIDLRHAPPTYRYR